MMMMMMMQSSPAQSSLGLRHKAREGEPLTEMPDREGDKVLVHHGDKLRPREQSRFTPPPRHFGKASKNQWPASLP